MDRLKFRVWDKQDEKMIYDGCVGAGSSCEFINIDFNGKLHLSNAWGLDAFSGKSETNCKRFVLMQSTLEKDKQGVEIWEGDIIESSGARREKYEVIFENFIPKIKSLKDGRTRNTPIKSISKYQKVIGNIFENYKK